MPALNRLYEQYKDRVAFYVVYIEEAHASDVWQLPVNEKQNVVYASPRSADERNNVATTCVRKLGIQFPAVVDDFENATERAYTAWPDRLYVIDREGRIAYKSAPGPFGFKPGQVASALQRMFPVEHAAISASLSARQVRPPAIATSPGIP